jgi:hypothetical protein
MKSYFLLKLLIKNEDGKTKDKYEIDSQWSQETELFCETVAYMVKTFIDELNSGELKKSADFIELIYDSRIAS